MRTRYTVFENHPKCRLWMFQFWHFPPIFVLLKLTCLVTLFDRKLQVFKNSPKWTIFGIFNQLLSTQNVNVARFARNVEWDFFCEFQTPCDCANKQLKMSTISWQCKQSADKITFNEMRHFLSFLRHSDRPTKMFLKWLSFQPWIRLQEGL